MSGAYNLILIASKHLASVSVVGGDMIVHILASGARASELKDPKGQVVQFVHV